MVFAIDPSISVEASTLSSPSCTIVAVGREPALHCLIQAEQRWIDAGTALIKPHDDGRNADKNRWLTRYLGLCFDTFGTENPHAMAALQDAIALIDSLISRLQTEPLANGAQATHASATGPSLPPVLATLSTAEQPRSTATVADSAASGAAAALPPATSPAAAVAANAHSHSGAAHQQPPEPAAGSAASAGAAGPDAGANQSAQEGRASAKKMKQAKAPKPPPQEPTPADMFAKAHIQVRKRRFMLSLTALAAPAALWSKFVFGAHGSAGNCSGRSCR